MTARIIDLEQAKADRMLDAELRVTQVRRDGNEVVLPIGLAEFRFSAAGAVAIGEQMVRSAEEVRRG